MFVECLLVLGQLWSRGQNICAGGTGFCCGTVLTGVGKAAVTACAVSVKIRQQRQHEGAQQDVQSHAAFNTALQLKSTCSRLLQRLSFI
jgi:hypothetical protein